MEKKNERIADRHQNDIGACVFRKKLCALSVYIVKKKKAFISVTLLNSLEVWAHWPADASQECMPNLAVVQDPHGI